MSGKWFVEPIKGPARSQSGGASDSRPVSLVIAAPTERPILGDDTVIPGENCRNAQIPGCRFVAMRRDLSKTSKFLSLVLRHDPGAIGLALDGGGWANIDELLEAARRHRQPITRAQLLEVVKSNDKARFAVDQAKNRIRANQGHSIDIDLGLSPTNPPEHLFHGTVARFLASIRENGLRPGKRQHVHLSPTEDVARNVGARRGDPVILTVNAGDMARAGFLFFLSENGVWLTDEVPRAFIAGDD